MHSELKPSKGFAKQSNMIMSDPRKISLDPVNCLSTFFKNDIPLDKNSVIASTTLCTFLGNNELL